MSEEEQDREEVGNIKDVRPSFEEDEQDTTTKDAVEQDHDLVSGDIDLDEVKEQREAENQAQDSQDDEEAEEEDDYLDILCRRPKQSGGSCGASKTTLVADRSHSKRYRCEVCKGVWTIQTGGVFPY